MTEAQKPWEQQYDSGATDEGAEPWNQNYDAPRGLKGWKSGSNSGFDAPKPSAFEGVKDSAIALGTGVTQGIGMLANVAGADNAVSRTMADATKALSEYESPYRKAEKQERARKIKEAEESGSTLKEVGAYLGSFAEAPIDTTLNALGTSLPTLAAGFIPGAGQAAVAARVAQLGLGAAQGVGAVKGQIFDEVKQAWKEKGATEEDAAARSTQAQSYTGDNAGSIALGGVLGAVAGSSGAEASVRRLAGKELAERAAQTSMLKGMGMGALKEAPMEGLQGGQERLASNLALQNEGFDQGTWTGVAGNAALEATASAPMGAGFGAWEAGSQQRLAQQEQQRRNEIEQQAAQQQANIDTTGGTPPASDAFAKELASASQAAAQNTSIDEDALNAWGAPPKPSIDTRQVDRWIGDDPAQPATPAPEAVRPSEAMGLRTGPDAGPLENAAALSVDSGLSDQMQGAAALANTKTSQPGGQGDAQQPVTLASATAAVQPQHQEPAAEQPAMTPQERESLASSLAGSDLSKASVEGANAQELQIKLDEVKRRAAENGSWNVPLMAQRRRIEDAMARLTAAYSPPTNEQQALQAELDAEQQGNVPRADRADRAFQAVTDATNAEPAAQPGAVEAAGPATIPATTGVTRESQASQTQQGSPQPTQAGAAQAGQITPNAAPNAGVEQAQAAPGSKYPPTDVRIGDKVVVDGEIYTVTAPIKQGRKSVGIVADRDSDTNPLAGVKQVLLKGDEAIAARLAALGQQPAQAAPDQRAKRLDEAGAQWTRMPAAERSALVGRLEGVKPVLAKNMPKAEWGKLNADVQGKLADAMGTTPALDSKANQPPTQSQQAQAATENEESTTGQLMQAAKDSGKLEVVTVGDKPADGEVETAKKTERKGRIESTLNAGGYVQGDELRTSNGMTLMKLTAKELESVPVSKVRQPPNKEQMAIAATAGKSSDQPSSKAQQAQETTEQQDVPATHADPGQAPEAATPAVVAESLQKAARNEDTKPSEMRKWLLAEIDKELLQAPDRADYDEAVKRMGEKDAISMFTGNGPLGKNSETGFVTFDVPGDGKYKVRNSVRGLLEFRKNVMASSGFKDNGQKQVKPEQNQGVQGGSGGKMAAITNMIEEGDFEAARDYAEAVGIKLEDVKVPRGDMKPAWEKYLKDGTLPLASDTRPQPAPKTAAQLDEDVRQEADTDASEASYRELIAEMNAKIGERQTSFDADIVNLKSQHFRGTGVFKGLRSKKAKDEAFNDAVRELRLSNESDQKAILEEYRTKIDAHPYESVRRAEGARKTREIKAQMEADAARKAAQPVTRADVEAAQQQAAAIIGARIDAMSAGDVNKIAKKFLPTMGMKPTMSKANNKAAMTDPGINLEAAAAEVGAALPAEVTRALQADMEGRVVDAQVDAAEQPTKKLTHSEAKSLMEWQDLGQKDGVKTHALTFYESQADKDAKRGRMIVARVSKGDRSATAWMVDGEDKTFGMLAQAKKRAEEVGMAKAVADGFVAEHNPFADYNALAQQYGYEVRQDGAIGSGGKFPGPTMKVKGGRLRIESGSGDLLASYAGTSPDGLGKFLESFWYAEKKADGFVEPAAAKTAAQSPIERAKAVGIKGLRADMSDETLRQRVKSYLAGERAARLIAAGKQTNLPQYQGVSEKDARTLGALVESHPYSVNTSGEQWVFDARGVTTADALVQGGLLKPDNGNYKHELTPVGKEIARKVLRSPIGDASIGDMLTELEESKPKTGNNGDFDPANPDIRFSFAGQQAATADKHALATAQQRLQAGEDAEAVRQETGWHQGADGKWRFEINDADAKLKDRAQWTAKIDGINAKRDAALQALWQAEEQRNDFLRARGESPSRISSETKKTPEFKALAKALKNAEAAAEKAQDAAFLARQGDSLITVGDVLSHPALFAAYPEIANVRVDINDSLPANNAAYAYELRAIELSGKSDAQQLLSTLLHEIQHGIQHIEGFATGGNEDSRSDVMQAVSQQRSLWADVYAVRRDLDAGKKLETVLAEWQDFLDAQPSAEALRIAQDPELETAVALQNMETLERQYAQLRNEGRWDTYRRLAGEVEARNTQARQNLTDAQRRATTPSQTADVADSDVIVMFNGKVAMSAPTPANAAPEGSADAAIRSAAAAMEAASRQADALYDADPDTVSMDYFAAIGDSKQAADAAMLDALDRLPDGGFAVEARTSDGRMLIVTPSASEQGRWQLTRFGKDGEPWGDTRFDTKRQVLQYLVDEAVPSSIKPAGAAMSRANQPPRTPAATIRAAINRAYGKLLGQLEAKGLVTLAQTEAQAIEAAAQARADKTGGDVAQIKRSLTAAMQGDTDLDVKRANGAVQGFFDPQTGQSFLIADNLSAEAAPGVLMHEVGIHMAADGSMKALFNRAATMLKLQKGNPFMKAVQARMDAAGETSGEEAAAYIAEAYENDRANAPASVQRWLTDLLAAVKAWLYKKGIVGADSLTVADVAAAARANARSMARDGGATGGQGFGPAFRMADDTANPDIRFSRAASPSQPAAWDAPVQTGFDDVIYKLQDKNIDLKRVVESITKATGQVADSINAYLKEELFHKRAAKRVADFGDRELKPLMNKMRLAGLSIEDVEEYLHARHAKEANAVIAQRNPGNAGLQDGGSGMTNAAADNYFAKLDPAQRRKLEAVAKSVDAIIDGTRKLYVSYGLEDQAVVDGWANMYQHYIPLMREDKDGGMGTGQGFSVKGKETKGRTGSTRKVVDILANVAMQREKLIVRGEKNIVAQALVGLAQANPNPDFWEVRSQAPTERVFDPKTGVVVDRPDPLFKSRENVAVAKVKDANGKVTEQMVVFNEDNPRAVRMAAAMKNLDAGNLEGLLGVSAKITRYFAAINTQYNPVFGVVNLVRDVQGAMVNLGTTPLAGQQGKIAKDTLSALRGIYGDIRKTRKGGQATSQWSQLWEQMQDDGGTTGYRDLFKTSADRANDLKSILNPEGWMDSKWGKFFTADGRLKVPLSMAQKGATEIFGWLSDYNEAMENGVRLAAYKAALDKKMSREQAASLAKNLTVNFNRKGQAGMQAGAVYAFFNAAMQGTARIGQTLFDMDGGDLSTLRLSKTGKAVVYGGVMLGVMQALALSAAGFDDDDPPEFVRERSLIIPTGDKTYVAIPMPLGLHVIPGIGRHATEFALSGFDKPAKRAVSMVGMFADAFNPIGNAGLSMQTIAPTALDPLVALSENKDWTGKPIARVSSNKAMPGHTQWKDTATGFSKVVAEAINWVSGGNEYVAGAFSPTPDQIDYLLAQVGGGVAREAAKVQQTITTAMSGETLPTHKIPLVGRFIGNAASQASQGSAFYANLNKLNELETEIKGLRKDGRFDEASKLARENPQSMMIAMANRAERDVQRLRREKRELIANDASREQVRAKEDQITAVMTRLNEAVERRKAQAAR